MTPDPTPSARTSGLFSEHFIGLMSGTSLDGVDGVLMQHTQAGWQTLAHAHRAMPPPLREAFLALNTPGDNELHRSAVAAQALVVLYAEVVQTLCESAQVLPSEVRAIGAHGQTVRHRPEHGYTCQLNQPALLAELSRIDVVADFRSRDIAAGGQGAPLVPAFHQSVFGAQDHTVATLNIGGFANIGVLRPNEVPLGFDCGPGNALLDLWCAQQTGQPYDANGDWSASGQVHTDWLNTALAEPFFSQAPPKSTGRDLFNAQWLARWLAGHGIDASAPLDAITARDVQATLCELSAISAAQAILAHAPQATEVIVCGGGALNGDLMRRLRGHLAGDSVHPGLMDVVTSNAKGLDVMQVEAAAFAWLAWTHLERLAGNVPAVTGARGPRVLGALYPAC